MKNKDEKDIKSHWSADIKNENSESPAFKRHKKLKNYEKEMGYPSKESSYPDFFYKKNFYKKMNPQNPKTLRKC